MSAGRRRAAAADPGAISGALAGAGFVAGLGGAMARSEHPYPRPGSGGAEIRRSFAQPSRAPWISVAGQLTSAMALARFTASVARLAGRAGRPSRPVALVALASVPPNLLGPLYLLFEPAGWLIPAGRFPGLIAAGLAGARLSRAPHR